MTLQEHLQELRSRLFMVAIFFALALGACYYFSQEIYNFLLIPFGNVTTNKEDYRLIFTSPAEAFISYLKLSFLSAIFFTTPIFLIQTYLFLAPALYKNEKKFITILLTISPLLFFCGAIIAYYYILPLAFNFFLNFENRNLANSSQIAVELEVRISEYLSFTKNIIFGFGIAFQMPILLLSLIKFKIISLSSLTSKRKYWILSFFLISAILTPPDILSQIFMASLMIILFEGMIFLTKFFEKVSSMLIYSTRTYK